MIGLFAFVLHCIVALSLIGIGWLKDGTKDTPLNIVAWLYGIFGTLFIGIGYLIQGTCQHSC